MRWWLLLLAGCGRIAFEPRGDASADAPPDAPCTWSAWSTPVLLSPVLQSTADDYAPSPALAQTQLYFQSYRTGSVQGDIWYSTRSDAAAAWGAPIRIAELSTSDNEQFPSVTEDALEMVWDVVPATGDIDVWYSSRSAVGDMWAAPVDLAVLNSTTTDDAPWISGDGLTLWFASARTPTTGLRDLYEVTRADRATQFQFPVRHDDVASTANDDYPTMSANGLDLWFASDRPGGPGGYDVYTAHRATRDQPFGTPVLVPELSSVGDDIGLRLAPSGDTMYMDYDYTGGGTSDLWVARRTCN